MYLPDINSWIALSLVTHFHHAKMQAWYARHYQRGLCFCRYTQSGYLRLLTNAKVMDQDVQTMPDAWQTYDRLIHSGGIRFFAEPATVETCWRTLTQVTMPATKLWNDAYLAAMAIELNLELVSFDNGFTHFPGLNCTIL